LRRSDQYVVASIVLVSLLAMAAYWLACGGLSGELVEIDQAAPLSAEFEVDLNDATWPELAQLPGIGEVLAHRIVERREVEGPYQQHSDLLLVRGIGPKLLRRIEPYLLPIDMEGAVGSP
jgi:competence protein ComEA